MLRQSAFLHLAKQDITGRAIDVLFYLLYKFPIGEWHVVNASQISQEMEMHRGVLSKCLSELVQHKVIERENNVEKSRLVKYRIHPLLGYEPDQNDVTMSDELFINNENLLNLIQLKLKGQVKKVLFFIIGSVEEGNIFKRSQAFMAREVSLSTPEVSRAMKKLQDHNIIWKQEKIGPAWVFTLTPLLVWKGDQESWQKAVENVERDKKIDNLIPVWLKL